MVRAFHLVPEHNSTSCTHRLPPDRVGGIVDKGHDFPLDVDTQLKTYGEDMWLFRENMNRETTRELSIYRGEHREFVPSSMLEGHGMLTWRRAHCAYCMQLRISVRSTNTAQSTRSHRDKNGTSESLALLLFARTSERHHQPSQLSHGLASYDDMGAFACESSPSLLRPSSRG